MIQAKGEDGLSATIHLLCGSTGAGKTTHARRLAALTRGVVFSIDAWMAALFWMDAPQPPDPAWTMVRIERCAARIWLTALDVARAGTPCILEIGLTTRAVRDRYAALARDDGVTVRLHLLDVDADERWRRVAARNAGGGELGFAITREMFDFVEAMWQPPTADELAGWDAVRVDPAP